VSLSSARLIHSSTSHPFSLKDILILNTHQHLNLLSVLFPSSSFVTNPVRIPPLTLHMPHPFHPPGLYHPKTIWWGAQITTIFIIHFFQSTVFFLHPLHTLSLIISFDPIVSETVTVSLNRQQTNKETSMTAGFHRDVDDICAPLGYYAASCGNCLPTFRNNVSVPIFKFKKSKMIRIWDRYVVPKRR
jgi:hypothetical protein